MAQVRSRVSLSPMRSVSGVTDDMLTFDATTQRTRDQRGQVIRHAKESAEDLTDDVIFEPEVLTITAHFTDTPMYYGRELGGFEGRAEQMAEAVRAIQLSKTRCLVFWGDKILPSRVIESVSEPRTPTTGDGVDIDLTLVQIDVGDLALVDAVVDAQTQALGDIDSIDIGWLP